MAKVLLTNKNSVWGVIVRPQSSNVYRHVMSFDNPDLKDQFIKDEVMNGKDYKVEIQTKSSVSLIYNDAASAIYQADPRDYPDETVYSLLNKDFAIVLINDYEPDPSKHKYLFYALSPKRNGSTVTYGMELDIFFTYDIKDMFNDKETEITRAMFDRFVKNSNGEIVSRDSYLDTPLTNPEKFDGDFSNLRFPVEEPTELIPVVRPTIVYKTGSEQLTSEELEFVYKLFTRMKWAIVTMSIKADDTHIPGTSPNTLNSSVTGLKGKEFGLLEFPMVHLLAPLALNNDEIEWPNDLSGGGSVITFNIMDSLSTSDNPGNRYALFDNFEPGFLNTSALLKNTLTVLAKSPVCEFDDSMKFQIYINKEKKPTYTSLNADFEIMTNFSSGNYITIKNASGENRGMLAMNKLSKDETIYNSNLIVNKNTSPTLSIANKRDDTTEPKLNFYPYTVFETGSSTKSKSVLYPEFFKSNNIKYKLNNSYLTSNWGYLIEFENYSNIYTINPFMNPKLNYVVEDFANYQLPTDNESWEDFITRNRSSQNASFINKGVGLGVGILGAIAAPFTLGASAAVAGIGLASIAAKSASDINQQIAQRKDIKNTPNTIVNTGSTLSYELINKGITPYIVKKTLVPEIKSQISDHIYKYGYDWGSKLAKPSDLIAQRYYFNYLEASDMFENIKLNLSSPIKQIINDTIESGVTIWNYRDTATFKGVKNYEYENVEMSLI